MKYLAATALALGFAAPAAAFDNASCRDFLTGTWAAETEQDVGGARTKITARSAYNGDGTFAQTMQMSTAGTPPQTINRAGAWDAGPGSKPDACLARLTPDGETESSIELTVIDANTVATPDGLRSTRAAP